MNIKLQTIRLQNYKAFRDTGWIELANLTLLLGYNYNGKSTILKALEMIQKCYQQFLIGQELPMLMTNDIEDVSFEDLLYKDSKDNTIAFSFRFLAEDEYINNGLEEFLKKIDSVMDLLYHILNSRRAKEQYFSLDKGKRDE